MSNSVGESVWCVKTEPFTVLRLIFFLLWLTEERGILPQTDYGVCKAVGETRKERFGSGMCLVSARGWKGRDQGGWGRMRGRGLKSYREKWRRRQLSSPRDAIYSCVFSIHRSLFEDMLPFLDNHISPLGGKQTVFYLLRDITHIVVCLTF